MNNQFIIERLKEQAEMLEDCKVICVESWTDTTKIFILSLWLDKKDDNFKKEIINMIQEYMDIVPWYDGYITSEVREAYTKKTLTIQSRLKNILETVIEILEDREEQLLEEEKKKEEEKLSKEEKKKTKKTKKK